jgi:hypothetical protein
MRYFVAFVFSYAMIASMAAPMTSADSLSAFSKSGCMSCFQLGTEENEVNEEKSNSLAASAVRRFLAATASIRRKACDNFALLHL